MEPCCEKRHHHIKIHQPEPNPGKFLKQKWRMSPDACHHIPPKMSRG